MGATSGEMSEQIEVTIHVCAVLDANQAQQFVRIRKIEMLDGKIERKIALRRGGKWITMPESAGYPEEAIWTQFA